MAENEGERRDGVADGDSGVSLGGVSTETAEALEDAGIEAADVTEKRVSYMDIVEAGVDKDAAAEVRRTYSLTWSSQMGDGLEDRAEEMGGLQAGERDWVALSASDWEELGVPEYDPVERETVDFWADHERPTSVRTVVDDWVADKLSDGGITSVRQLAWVDAAALAGALDVGVMQARTWRFAAREYRR
jgi:hypothetical protein